MYLLDTNHCSRIIAGDHPLIQQLQAHLEDGIATSVIVRGERLQPIHPLPVESWL
jgi:tRNA(fMet)-specific endonuclease VapC